MGLLDERGRGYADGQSSPADTQAPKVMITEKAVTMIDGSGKATETPCNGGRSPSGSKGLTSSPDIVLRVNSMVVLRHVSGRTVLDFQGGGVSHSIVVGELHGDEVIGMSRPEPRALAEDTVRDLGDAARMLDGVRTRVAALKVDPSQKGTKPSFTMDTKNFKDVLENLATLKQHLSCPGLASLDLEWDTVPRLRKLLAAEHPQCPGQGKHGWTVSRISGKCTEERLANVKPTVLPPKTIATVSQLKLPEMVDELSSRNVLLVVICLATYALEQSEYARSVAEKAHTELWQRYCTGPDGSPPVRLVAVELSESGDLTQRYGVKEVPYCLMFQGGHLVYSKRLRGLRTAGHISLRPRVLLVEPSPAQQLKLERALRRNGFGSDLALDAPQALRLASRSEAYGILLLSSLLRPEQLRAIAAAARRVEPAALVLAFDGAVPAPDEDVEARKRFLDECNHVFLYAPSYTGLAAVLARFDITSRLAAKHGHSHKQDFVDEVLGVLDRNRAAGGPSGAAMAVSG